MTPSVLSAAGVVYLAPVVSFFIGAGVWFFIKWICSAFDVEQGENNELSS